MIEELTSYNGNKLLKPGGITHPFSVDQVEELMKCTNSCEYFIHNYVKIVTLDYGVQQFAPYAYQDNIINTVQESRFVIVKCGRQQGKTTIISAILLWHILFTEYFTIAICANKAKNSASVLARVKLAYSYLPKWMQQGIVTWNKGDIELENGSKVLTYATSEDACRGETINMLYLDEFCFVPRNIQVSFFESVYPTISSGKSSKILITSTPKGLDYFYKLWTEAKEGKNSYVPIEVHWSDIPGRDEEWKEETIGNIGQAAFDVEYECQFLGSTNTLISTNTLKTIPHIDPIAEQDSLTVYQYPITSHEYILMADTGRGVGADFSTFIIIDITTLPYQIVSVYRDNNIAPTLFPTHIAAAGKSYNEALALIETNDLGEQVVNILYNELEYDSTLFTTHRGRKGVVLGGGFGKSSSLGIRTTKTTKAKGCSNLKSIIESGKLIINDLETLFELTNFVSVKASYEADTGYHDDLVMCLVLFAWMVDQSHFKELTSIDLRSLLHADKEARESNQILNFLVSTGHENDIEYPEAIGNTPATVEEYGDEMLGVGWS